MKFSINLMVVALILIFSYMESAAQEWTQWRGENRTCIQNEKGLNLDWASKKPAVLWVYRDAGMGYSSPVIADNTLYMSGAADGKDFAYALDAKTGDLKWKQTLGEQYEQDRGDGPRGTMTLDKGTLYLIRGAGQVHALSAADGKILWQADLVNDFGGKIMSQWGYSESPLIDGDLLICTPGGAQGTLIALDKNSGKLVWACKEWTDEAGYSSPIVAEIYGVRQYIQQSNKGVAGVAAKDGKLLWRIEGDGYRTAVIPTPIYHENVVYVTAGYGAGCTAVKLTKDGDKFKTEIVYQNKNMVNHHGGVVLMNGHIYGFCDQSGWKCQNLSTGESIWNTGRTGETAGIGKGAILGVNDRILLLEEKSGLMVIAAASPDGWKEFGKMEIPERSQIETKDKMVWTHPVIVNGKLYLRDQDLLFCIDLK
ncbi:MAG: PQQ-binding-like beta-propeller repeat protein [Marinilabiliaceae bacterium]|nr:PQQ-binding-like beta-propeller repeat protein [Marinilabiliaceae bacterium]